jgi:hypothetical protein
LDVVLFRVRQYSLPTSHNTHTNIEKSKYLFNALFAAIILFVLIVQRWGPQPAITKSANVWFEIVKSGAATAIWIWLVIVRSLFLFSFIPILSLPSHPLLSSPSFSEKNCEPKAEIGGVRPSY